MGSFEPSKYQKDILDFIENKTGNLLVDAKAGSGKTSTLILIADKIIEQNKKCLFLAFNKSIVEELKTRIISDNCEIKTLHSLGLSFLRSYLYKKHRENYVIEVDQHDDFIKDNVSKLFDKYCKNEFELVNSHLPKEDLKDLHYNIVREISQMVNYSRLYNVNYHEHRELYDLGSRLTWYLSDCDEYGVVEYPKIVEEVIDIIKANFAKPEENEDGKFVYRVGYTDMIYFPCLHRMYPPFALRSYLDYVLVDEVQDLSVLQQMFIKLLISDQTRLICVGDENQAIYAFAGADTKSIQNLKKNFALTQLPLNICYRCPEKIIKIAQDIVPTIDWNHDREDKGEVQFVKEEELKDKIEPGDVIVARRNNDLIRLYRKFILEDKICVKFRNGDMVNTLVTEMSRVIKEYIKKYNTGVNVEKDLYAACDKEGINWKLENDKLPKAHIDYINKKANELIKTKKRKSREICKSNFNIDYLETCMKDYKEEGQYNYTVDGEIDNIFTDYYDIIETLLKQFRENNFSILVKDFITYVEDFLKGNLSKNVPVLSSIHMMKGGEADNIFIIDYPRFPYINSHQTSDTQQQEKNLQYVALTRPKKNLYLCYISRCRSRETEDTIADLNTSCEIEVKRLMNRVTLL